MSQDPDNIPTAPAVPNDNASDETAPIRAVQGDVVPPIPWWVSNVNRGVIVSAFGFFLLVCKILGKEIHVAPTDVALFADLFMQLWPFIWPALICVGGYIITWLGRRGICMPIEGTKAAKETVTLKK